MMTLGQRVAVLAAEDSAVPAAEDSAVLAAMAGTDLVVVREEVEASPRKVGILVILLLTVFVHLTEGDSFHVYSLWRQVRRSR